VRSAPGGGCNRGRAAPKPHPPPKRHAQRRRHAKDKVTESAATDKHRFRRSMVEASKLGTIVRDVARARHHLRHVIFWSLEGWSAPRQVRPNHRGMGDPARVDRRVSARTRAPACPASCGRGGHTSSRGRPALTKAELGSRDRAGSYGLADVVHSAGDETLDEPSATCVAGSGFSHCRPAVAILALTSLPLPAPRVRGCRPHGPRRRCWRREKAPRPCSAGLPRKRHARRVDGALPATAMIAPSSSPTIRCTKLREAASLVDPRSWGDQDLEPVPLVEGDQKRALPQGGCRRR
jgi:hypothetical protein